MTETATASNNLTVPQADPMLTLHQFAIMMAISDKQATTICENGKVPAKDMGLGRHRSWRIKLSDARHYRDTPDNIRQATPAPSSPKLPSHIPCRA